MVESLLGIARPHLLLDAVHSWSADVQLYVAVGARIVIGLLLFVAAPSCGLPRFTRVLGVIVFLVGIVFAFIGASRLESMVQCVSAQPNWTIRYCTHWLPFWEQSWPIRDRPTEQRVTPEGLPW